MGGSALLRCLLAFVLAVAACAEVLGEHTVTFELEYAQQTCFILEVPHKPTKVIVGWEFYTPILQGTVSLTILDTRGATVASTLLDIDSQGWASKEKTYAFTSHGDAGSYRGCFQSSGGNRNSFEMSAHIDVLHADEENRRKLANTQKMQDTEADISTHVDANELEAIGAHAESVTQLLYLGMIQIETFKDQQRALKEHAEHVATTAIYWGALQLSVMVAISWAQGFFLKQFLTQKKLV
eukprot:Rhum_TRINITY_DN290_c0_g1::Rhum_TRINITY_DN290_c0_g1_i1::g.1012::m.1012/K20352/TMED10, ERV25; p24 family protein delta-1